VWADSTDADFGTSGSNQFLVRASGGVAIGGTNPGSALHIVAPTGLPPAGLSSQDNGLLLGSQSISGFKWIQSYGGALVLNFQGNNVGIGTTNPATLLDVTGTITCVSLNQTSDRNVKENFAPVSPLEVLNKVTALPITTWTYKELRDGRHLGPMAQDFHAAFGTGSDDKRIATVDAEGVALAAIQGLNQELETQIAAQKAKDNGIADLERRLAALEKLIESNVRKGN